MGDTIFRSFLRAVETAPSADRAWEAVSALAQAEGLPRLRVTLHGGACASSRAVHSAGFDAEAERRLARLAARAGPDPVAARALSGAPPFSLSRMAEEDLSPARRRSLDDLRAAAGGDLTLFAVFGPDGCDAVCALGHSAGVAPPEPSLHRIRSACQIAHLKALRIRGRSHSGPALSEREREVLAWLVQGKTNAAIAGILGCSAHTVDTHVRRIFAKLEVSDRTSASLRAVELGLVAL